MNDHGKIPDLDRRRDRDAEPGGRVGRQGILPRPHTGLGEASIGRTAKSATSILTWRIDWRCSSMFLSTKGDGASCSRRMLSATTNSESCIDDAISSFVAVLAFNMMRAPVNAAATRSIARTPRTRRVRSERRDDSPRRASNPPARASRGRGRPVRAGVARPPRL